jgi:hypothetical protein
MKRLRINEKNISRYNLWISFSLVAFIALALLFIYFPQYYREYDENISKNNDQITKIYKDKIRLDILSLTNNLRYRYESSKSRKKIDLSHNTLLFTRYFKKHFDKSILNSHDISEVLEELKSLTLNDSQSIVLLINDKNISISDIHKNTIVENSEVFSTIKKLKFTNLDYIPESLNLIINNRSNNDSEYFSSIRYVKKIDAFIGIAFPVTNFNNYVKKLLIKEIDTSIAESSEEYTFAYEILNINGHYQS